MANTRIEIVHNIPNMAVDCTEAGPWDTLNVASEFLNKNGFLRVETRLCERHVKVELWEFALWKSGHQLEFLVWIAKLGDIADKRLQNNQEYNSHCE